MTEGVALTKRMPIIGGAVTVNAALLVTPPAAVASTEQLPGLTV